MAKPKGHKNRLSNTFRFSIFNDTSHEELFAFRAKGLLSILVIALVVVFLIVSVTLIISYTPIKHMIPGYPSAESQRELVQKAIKLDSLQNEINLWKQQLVNIQLITTGQEPVKVQAAIDSTALADTASVNREKWAAQEKTLREEVETNSPDLQKNTQKQQASNKGGKS